MSVQDQIRAVAAKYGVSASLALAVADKESKFNQAARGTSGEVGIFQLMPGTARDLGVNPYDAGANIEGGVRYLRQLLDRYNGDTTLALQAYNGGMGNVDRGTVSAAARRYAQEILAFLGIGDSPAGGSGGGGPITSAFSPVSLSDFSLPAVAGGNPWLLAALAVAGASVFWLLVFREA